MLGKCLICCESDRTVVLRPCNHCATCYRCVERMLRKQSSSSNAGFMRTGARSTPLPVGSVAAVAFLRAGLLALRLMLVLRTDCAPRGSQRRCIPGALHRLRATGQPAAMYARRSAALQRLAHHLAAAESSPTSERSSEASRPSLQAPNESATRLGSMLQNLFCLLFCAMSRRVQHVKRGTSGRTDYKRLRAHCCELYR